MSAQVKKISHHAGQLATGIGQGNVLLCAATACSSEAVPANEFVTRIWLILILHFFARSLHISPLTLLTSGLALLLPGCIKKNR